MYSSRCLTFCLVFTPTALCWWAKIIIIFLKPPSGIDTEGKNNNNNKSQQWLPSNSWVTIVPLASRHILLKREDLTNRDKPPSVLVTDVWWNYRHWPWPFPHGSTAVFVHRTKSQLTPSHMQQTQHARGEDNGQLLTFDFVPFDHNWHFVLFIGRFPSCKIIFHHNPQCLLVTRLTWSIL